MEGRGSIGKLLAGYHFAASIRDWYLTGGDRETFGPIQFIVSAKVVDLDMFLAAQVPTKMGLYLGQNVWWVWNEPVLVSGLPIRKGELVELQCEGIPGITNKL